MPRRITPEPGREIAHGSERRVYLVGDPPGNLLKVMRSKYLKRITDDSDQSLIGWLRLRAAYALFRRENRAWTDAMLRAAVRKSPPPLAGVSELVLTPQGLGQLVEHIRDADGNTAPTLHDLMQDAPLSDKHLEALNTFVAELYDWHITAYDLGPRNIVWHESRHAFVLVDGFGERALLPLKTWVRALNNRRLDRAFAQTATKCPLTWIRAQRRFERPG